MRTSANRVLAIVAAVVAIVAIVVAALTASWTVSDRDPASPEGVVQTYLTAVFDGRTADAAALLDPTGDCTADNLDTAYVQRSARVDLVETTLSGDTAQVKVRVEFSNDDPFGGSYGEDHTYRLLRVEGVWRITGVPWPLYGCGPVVK